MSSGGQDVDLIAETVCYEFSEDDVYLSVNKHDHECHWDGSATQTYIIDRVPQPHLTCEEPGVYCAPERRTVK